MDQASSRPMATLSREALWMAGAGEAAAVGATAVGEAAVVGVVDVNGLFDGATPETDAGTASAVVKECGCWTCGRGA